VRFLVGWGEYWPNICWDVASAGMISGDRGAEGGNGWDIIQEIIDNGKLCGLVEWTLDAQRKRSCVWEGTRDVSHDWDLTG